MLKLCMRLIIVMLIGFSSLVSASPSAFPENAAFFQVGYNGAASLAAGAEFLLPVRYLDFAAAATAFIDSSGIFGVKADGTALVFPALGTVPPLALGVAVDMSLSNEAFSLHAGPVFGSDFLFVSDLPMTASLYLGPGYATNTGFSLAWSAYLRYYFDDFAVELASSEQAFISLAFRYFF